MISLEIVASQSCHEKCKFCSVDLAECEDVSSLNSVLSGLPSLTRQIFLRHGNLSVIPPGSFQNFSDLQLLSLTGFMVLSLINQTFATKESRSSLKKLDLNRNHLFSCGVAASAFSGLGKLEELFLSHNALDTLKKSWWSDMNSLHKLVISDNKITYLPPRMFENLTQLNQLTMPKNLIQYLITDTFYGLVSLTELDLSNNTIIFVSEDAFQPLQKLKLLNLFQNRLVTLPDISDSVTSLVLHKNPWNCSCKLVRMLTGMEEKVQNPTNLLCESPENVRKWQLLNARPEVCGSAPTEKAPSPQSTINMNSVYGFLGGLFFTLMIWLVAYFIARHWRSNKRTTSPTVQEDPKCNLKAETPMVKKSTDVPLASQCLTKCESWKIRTDLFQREHETNSLEIPHVELYSQTLADIEVHPTADLSRQPFNTAVIAWDPINKTSKVSNESIPCEQSFNQFAGALFQNLDKETEKIEGIPKCASAPGLLPTLDDPKMLSTPFLFPIAEVPKHLPRNDWFPDTAQPEISQKADLCPVSQDLRGFPVSDLRPKAEMFPKGGVGFLNIPFNDEEATQLRKIMDTELGLKYFETQHEEKVVESVICSSAPSPPSDTLEIATYHPESMIQMDVNNRAMGQRSKTWSTFYGTSSEPTEKQGDGSYDGNEVCAKKLEVSSVSSMREQPFVKSKYEENLQGEESRDSPKNDRSIDLSDESISEKELVEDFCSKLQFSSCSSESCDEQDTEGLEDVETNSTPVVSPQSTPTRLQKSRGGTKVRVPIPKSIKMSTYETKLASPYFGHNNTQQKTVCEAEQLGKGRLHHKKQRSKKSKQRFSLPSDRLTKERFWKYHKNCCDEYKPCATAKKVLKYIKTAPTVQLDNESIQSPPSDLDLLEDQSTALPLSSKSINGKEDSFKPQKKTLKNKNCVSFRNLVMGLDHGGVLSIQKQPHTKSTWCGTPRFIKVKPALQAENQLGSVDLAVHDQYDLPGGSVTRQVINVCDVFSERLFTAENKRTGLCITSVYSPATSHSDVLLSPSICASAIPADSGKRKTIKIPAVSETESPIQACLQLSKVAFSKMAANMNETSLACGSSNNILVSATEVPEYSEHIHEALHINTTRLPPQQLWLGNMDCAHELPSLPGSGEHGSMLSYHSDKLLHLKKRENRYQNQRNAGIVQLEENGQCSPDVLMAKELRLSKHSGEVPSGSLIKNNSVLDSSSCSNDLSVTYASNMTDNPCNTCGLFEKGINQPDVLEDSRPQIANLYGKASVSMLEPQNLRYVTHNRSDQINDGKYSKCRDCLIDSKDELYLSEDHKDDGRSLDHLQKFSKLEMDGNSGQAFMYEQKSESSFQKERSVNLSKEINLSLNDYFALKLSRRIYRSVFKLPVWNTPWEESHQNEDSKILSVIPESERYKMKAFPSPNVLKKEPESTLDLIPKSKEFAIESVAKTLSSLYKANPPRKLIHNFFQKLEATLPEISDLSVLSNLHFCKIAEVTVSVKNEEGAKQFQDHDDDDGEEQFQEGESDAVPEPILSSNSGHYRSPTRQELNADSELSLMNTLCSLKRSLEHSGAVLKSNKLDP